MGNYYYYYYYCYYYYHYYYVNFLRHRQAFRGPWLRLVGNSHLEMNGSWSPLLSFRSQGRYGNSREMTNAKLAR